MGMLGVAIVALIGVFFALPNWVENAEPTAAVVATKPASKPVSNEVQASSAPTPSERSPFSEAQLAMGTPSRAGGSTDCPGSSGEPQTLGVEPWAASKYETATQEALSGDAAYRERDFAKQPRFISRLPISSQRSSSNFPVQFPND